MRLTRQQAEQILEQASSIINLDTIPLDDPQVFARFQEGRTDGIYMCESNSMQYDLRMLKPSNMDELTDAMALTFGIYPNRFIYWYIKKQYVPQLTYPILPLPHEVENILQPTRGLLLYREQQDALNEFLRHSPDATNPTYTRGLMILRKMIKENGPHTTKRSFHAKRALMCYQLAYIKEHIS